MKRHISRIRFHGLVLTLASLMWLPVSPDAYAVGDGDDPEPPVVAYTPEINPLGTRQAPYSTTYDVLIKSPSNMLAQSADVPVTVTSTARPPGVDAATAESFVILSAPTLNFTGPGQIRALGVKIDISSSAVEGAYVFNILADGFPLTAGTDAFNIGSAISITVAPADAEYTKPVIVISGIDGGTITADALPYGPIPFSFTITSTGPYSSEISSQSFDLDGIPGLISLSSLEGQGTKSVSGTGTFSLASEGVHVVTVRGTNLGGTTEATVAFELWLTGVPPRVRILTPTDDTVVAYDAAGPRPAIPFHFTASSTSSPVEGWDALLGGAPINPVISGEGTTELSGVAADLAGVVAGESLIFVNASNSYGSGRGTSVTFTVNPVDLVIASPATETISLPPGAVSADIGFEFTTTSLGGVAIDSVAAELDGGAMVVATPGLTGAASATSSGTLAAVGIGGHTFSAQGTSSGLTVTRSVEFRVKGTPVIQWATPSPIALGEPLSGTQLSAVARMSDGSQIPGTYLYSAPAGTVLPAGSHELTVSFQPSDPINYYGATGSTSLLVYVPATPEEVAISGLVYHDVDFDGVRSPTSEPALAGATVRLLDAMGAATAVHVTGANGSYEFTVAANSGSYTLEITGPLGMSATSAASRQTVVAGIAGINAAECGFGLNWSEIGTLTADGMSQGFWKNNIAKAIAGKTNGIQVSKATLLSYTAEIAGLALEPFDGLTLNQASEILSGKNQLELQLLAAEYNFENGAYIGGSEPLTRAFVYWGEAVLRNADGYYSRAYQKFAAERFEAYNTSHGAKVLGPKP